MARFDPRMLMLEYSASILSIVWSSGKAHTSIHRVHEEILSLVADGREMHT